MCLHTYTHWAAGGDKHSHWLFSHFSRHNNSNQCYCFIGMKAATAAPAARVCVLCVCVFHSWGDSFQEFTSCGCWSLKMGAILSSGRDPGWEVKVVLFRRFEGQEWIKANGTSLQMDCCVIIAGVHLCWEKGRGRNHKGNERKAWEQPRWENKKMEKGKNEEGGGQQEQNKAVPS